MGVVDVASAAEAKKFIRLYMDHSNSAEQIARAMGWKTTNARQMVNTKLRRLRAKGYVIPGRRDAPAPSVRTLSLEQATEKVQAVASSLREQGWDVEYSVRRLDGAN